MLFKMFISLFSAHLALGYQLSIGDCIVYYEEPCQRNVIQFHLSLLGKKILLDPFNTSLPKDFNFAVPLKILIHGYGGYEMDSAIKNVSNTYIDEGFNVITVDWSGLGKVPCYPTAFLNTWHVGQCLAILAVSLAAFGLTPDKLHVVGFSLGSHIASFASNHLQKTLGIPFDRITGLDPALPFFASFKRQFKLDKTDARFVDVIHTNAGSFGKIEAMGHADFYVNGGSLQPACQDLVYAPLCSHFIVGEYFAESITSKNFIGFECNNALSYVLGLCPSVNSAKAIMGEHCNRRSQGSFYLNTADKPPYSLGRRLFIEK